ncbi:tetratricopeptide repeat protein [Pelagibius sp. Alg239-R121]|uniref:tetratricopeptide repeat protein n=1 Tax=Pelagibius sp. Alg239-R121 TaxID=2993448 RepID=UPI0024A6381A|nr:tetratricopeptide repeat protein [Pelagibius sp. Alg239-R121]
MLILAEAYVDAKRHKEASEAYRFALLIDSANGDAHFGLGKLYLRESKLEEAKPHLEAALSSGKEDPAIFNAMGILLDQLGQHAEAQQLYYTGLDIQPENTALANNLGVSLLLSERLDEGVSVLGNLQPNSRPNLIRRSNLETAQAVASASHIVNSTASVIQIPDADGVNDTPTTALLPVADQDAKQHLVTSSVKTAPRLTQLKPKSAKAPKIEISSPQITPAPKSTSVTIQPILDSVGNSSVVAAEDLAPEVSPAPIVVVDFQTLPTLPVEQAIADLPDTERTFTARSDKKNQLPEATDVAGTPSNTVENLRAVTAPAPKSAAAAVRITVIKPQALKDLVDLAQITPRRKPVPVVDIELDFADLATQTPAYKESRTVTLSDITHLPDEEPGVDRSPADGVIQLNPPKGHHSRQSLKDSPSRGEPQLFVAKAPASTANDQISDLVDAWALSTASSVLLESTSRSDEIVSDAIRSAPSEPQIVRRHVGQSGDLNIDAKDVDTDTEAEDDSKPLLPQLTDGFLASLPSQAEQTHAVGDHDDQTQSDPAPIDWPGFLVDHIDQSQFPIPRKPHDQNALALMLLSREFFATG